jgi:DNA-binding HxlR family transcriptional regulator
MKHKYQRRSGCPINFALETFGDPWSLLIIRDMVYFRKRTYSEFFVSEEGIATNILASRLAHLEQQGILVKKPQDTTPRRMMLERVGQSKVSKKSLDTCKWGKI